MSKLYNIHTIWLAMLLLTLTTYAIGKLGYNGMAIIFLLIISTVIKAIFIIRDFMELRGVSLLWRVIMYGWLLIVCAGITIAYIISL